MTERESPFTGFLVGAALSLPFWFVFGLVVTRWQ